jgi:tyrosinase
VNTEIVISGSDSAGANYLTWSPVRATIRLLNPSGSSPVDVVVDNPAAGQGGRLDFSKTRTGPASDTLQLKLKASGAKLTFYVAGKFGRPSTADKDTVIRVRRANTTTVLSTTAVMVRIRKDANKLTPAERDRFINAMATLNNGGMGAFTSFRDMHTEPAEDEAHGSPGFLPWHRAYTLDLERALQAIDPSVTLPYWKFDVPAPNLFTREFIGVSQNGRVAFAGSNPLQFWATDQSPGISRTPKFNTATSGASALPFPVMSEDETLGLGQVGARFDNFDNMEGDPHGSAHMNFGGYLSAIPQAARDPLFFLLHANVDRLWAKWQWQNRRFDGKRVETFFYRGNVSSTPHVRVGHNLRDTMWPWNQVTGNPRPPTAPGGSFPPAPHATAPGPTPFVGSMIDYQGKIMQSARLGFDYDDVPFER